MAMLFLLGAWPAVASATPFCSDTWTGAGKTALWETPANWSAGEVPGFDSVACIGSGTTVEVGGGTYQVAAVQDEGELVVAGGSLELTNVSLEVSDVASLTISAGTLAGPGTIDVAGSFVWSSGTMSGSGSTVLGSGATGTIDGSSLYLEGRDLVNDGLLKWTEGRIVGYAGEIDNAGTFEANEESSAYGYEGSGLLSEGYELPSSVLRNTGTIKKTTGPLFTNIDFAVDNEGTIECQAGQIIFSDGTDGTNGPGGHWNAAEGGELSFNGGDFKLGTEAAMSGTIVAYADLEAGGIQGSDATLRLYLSPGHVDLTNSAITSHVENLEGEGGTLAGPGTMDIGGSLTWKEGEMSGHGSTVIESEATGEIVGGELHLFERSLVNRGTMILATGRLAISGGSLLTNTGTFDANSEAGYPQVVVGSGGGTASIVNSGSFDKTAGGGTTTIEPSFENHGSTHALTGRLSFLNPVTDTSASKQYGGFNPSAEGHPPGSECGDPIDCVTGNLAETQTDFSIGGRGIGLDLTRTYNAQAAAAGEHGAFGYGWSNSFSEHLDRDEATHTVTLVQANGSTVPFAEEGGALSAPVWSQDTLTGNAEAGYVLTLADLTVYRFSGAGALESVTERSGNRTSLAYEAGRLASISDPAGREITFSYNSEGLVQTATDPMGHTVHYGYEDGELTSVTEPGEEIPRWRFGYDASHRITSMINGVGGETTNTYNSANQVTSQTDPSGHTLAFEYEAFQTKITNESTGSVTLDAYDSNDALGSITHGYGTAEATTTSFSYNEAGEPISETNGAKQTTSYEYDEAGDRVKEIDPEGHESRWTYNPAHEVTSETLPSGETTSIEYDAHDNPIKISRPGPEASVQSTRYEYNSSGELTAMIDPLGHEWTYGYDEAGDLTSETDPAGDTSKRGYDEDSQQTSEVSPPGNVSGGEPAHYTSRIERNAQGLPTKTVAPEGQETSFEYDADGDLAAVTDPDGHKTTTSYNAEGLPVKQTQPSGATSETGYDGAGQVVSQTNGDKDTTTYVRNVLGEVTEVIEPLKHETSKTYDANGELASVTSPEGQKTSYSYDDDGQLSTTSYSEAGTHAVEYEYNPDGQLVSMSDGTGTTSYTYDQLGRLTETSDGHGAKVAYAYNLANQNTTITYPNGKTVKDSYDDAGRLAAVTDWLGQTTSFAYNPNSQQTSTSFPEESGESDHYVYSRSGQMSKASMLKGSETLAAIEDGRDMDGQLTSVSQTGLPGAESTEYTYTENDQLASAGTTAYEYDAAGNPTELGSSTNTFNAGSELVEDGTNAYSYDDLGQRTKVTPATGPATSYGYDQAGDLISVTRPEEGSTPAVEDSYAYNGEGLRASETIGGTSSYLTWDVAEPLPLLLSSGAYSFIYGPGGLPVEQISNEGQVTYLHHDQAGSTRLLTGEKGEAVGSYTYGAYGETTGHTGTATTPLGYDAQYTSPDTGFIYLRNRTYDPSTAQFTSVDPAVSVTQEPYAYAGDNPLNEADPTGLEAIPLPAPVAGGCVAAPEICGAAALGGADIYLGIKVFNSVAGSEGGDEGEQELKEREQEGTDCTANQIANGHAFERHADEFGAETPDELEQVIKDALENATKSRELSNGRTAYYDEETNTLVIVDPSSPDGGTIFKPSGGEEYFNGLQ
jgi:RHS repeat-associated protein